MKLTKRFLRTTLYENDLLRIDYWTFIHMVVGFSLYRFFGLEWILALFLLVAYEVIETLLVPWFFKPEKIKDTVFDIIAGMAGYYIAMLI